MVREAGDDLPLVWLEAKDRYQEKLATPDVTIADLIGDLDPIKAMARKLDFDNEEVIHYGIVPRSNRCVFAIDQRTARPATAHPGRPAQHSRRARLPDLRPSTSSGEGVRETPLRTFQATCVALTSPWPSGRTAHSSGLAKPVTM